MANNSGMDNVEDLISLAQGNTASDEASVVEVLNSRYSKDLTYTRIGENIVVSVNPYKPLEANSDSSVKTYSSAAKEGTERRPHVFEVSANAFFNATKMKQNQSIVMIGDTGSGKSENFKLALNQLVSLAKSKSKEDRVAGRLLKLPTVLEAFGHARTINSPNASRFGKCVEVQLNARGRLAGAKISDYLLEKSRVTDIPYGERTFNVFYYLLAGAPADQQSKLQLNDASKFFYLSSGKMNKSESTKDAEKLIDLKNALKSLGFKDKLQHQIFQLLACILHLGNLEFIDGEMKEEAAIVKNHDVLDMLADLLGVRPANLENSLVYKTKLIKKEICTIFLDKEEAAQQRDALARTLYSLLWSYLIETMNKRLCNEESTTNFVTLVDMFGIENLKDNFFHQMLYNFTAEKMLAFMNDTLFDREITRYRQEQITFDNISYGDNSQIIDLFSGRPNGVFTLLDEESSKRKKGKVSAVLETLNEVQESNQFFIAFPKKSKSKMFGIKHHSQDVYYEAADFVNNNTETISADFVSLFRGNSETTASKNIFITGLFSEKSLSFERAPANDATIVDALQVNAPRRQPSVRRSKKATEAEVETSRKRTSTFLSSYQQSLNVLLESLQQTNVSFVICLKPNAGQHSKKWENKLVRAQVVYFGIADIIQIRSKGFNIGVSFEKFTDQYRLLNPDVASSEGAGRDKCVALIEKLSIKSSDYKLGSGAIFFNETATRKLQMSLRALEREEKKRLKEKLGELGMEGSIVGSQLESMAGDTDYYQSEDDFGNTTEYDGDYTETGSNFGSESSYVTEKTDIKKEKEALVQAEEEEQEMSGARKWWLRVTTLLTFWIPNRCLEWNGMKRSDIQQAWREKVALCILILLLSVVMLFFIAGLSLILCPRDNLYDWSEISGHNTQLDMWIGVQGQIFDYTSMSRSHSAGPEFIYEFAGRDATSVFPRNAEECGLEDDGRPHDKTFNASFAHPFGMQDAVFNKKNKYWKGFVAYKKDEISKEHGKPESWWLYIGEDIYDFTNYRYYDQRYLGEEMTNIILQYPGSDATKAYQKSPQAKKAMGCMRKIHFIGRVDTRDRPECIFANTLLIVATGILVGIMVIKFLCALRVTSKGDPEDHDRFVICMVPCYTEGEEQLRRTLDSLATLQYDDKRKLLFIIADGNIVGSGNDRATWRIALDIFGVDPSIDPPKLSFHALGEGNKQHNMGKVYTGLYDLQGHLVPFLVLVKVGKDSEAQRPGNRGKRDSQMILMRFLQKVHYDEPMSPLELEMYHQIKNVIGVDPSFYEFTLMVDADTIVVEDSLNRLVSAMVHDAKTIGICGETTVANEKDTWITMMQVYEYYISHHLAKAFESLFGSVTCLPGCFCMYRVRSPNKSIPLLIAKPVIQDYSVNDVDTLHKKNLLSLGEDRYLTTLMLKHFPNMKISFTADAMCKTYAPERWSVLLSQRRRWINSTVHNLAELLLLPQLCGFCCFSMRFIVFFDLFATLVMPATMAYLGYLIYMAIVNQQIFPMVSLILICAAYGLQVIIFLLKRKWEHIGWMIIYILALPMFTFFIPIYSFWHFDDFSWGNTRVVVGEKGGKKQILDEEPFDPLSIPMKRWSDYEQEMFENESNATGMTQGSYTASHVTQSVMNPSMVGSQYQAVYGVPPPGYPQAMSYASRGSAVMSRPVSMVHAPAKQMNVAGRTEEYPSDEQIAAQIKTILATANLMTVTKKQVRDELAAFFNTDMNSRKTFINKVIEDVLKGKM